MPWTGYSDSSLDECFSGCNSPQVALSTALDAGPLTTGAYKAKYMRGANSALEHTDEVKLTPGTHRLSLTNTSGHDVYLALYGVSLQEAPPHWDRLRQALPFHAPWFAGPLPPADRVWRWDTTPT